MLQTEGVPVFIQPDTITTKLTSLPQNSQVPIPPISTTMRQVLVPEVVIPSTLCKGEPSHIHEFKSKISPEAPSSVKKHDKNVIRTYYPTPKPDTFKFLGDELIKLKKIPDVLFKSMMAFIHKNGLELCIHAGYPNFNKAKAEEITRVMQEGQVSEPFMHNEESHIEREVRLARELE